MPFAVQWAWIPLILPILIFAPESPYWLVRKGKIEQAEKVVSRIAAPEDRDRCQDIVSAMVRTNTVEKNVHEGTSFLDCFRGVDRRRTEIRLVLEQDIEPS